MQKHLTTHHNSWGVQRTDLGIVGSRPWSIAQSWECGSLAPSSPFCKWNMDHPHLWSQLQASVCLNWLQPLFWLSTFIQNLPGHEILFSFKVVARRGSCWTGNGLAFESRVGCALLRCWNWPLILWIVAHRQTLSEWIEASELIDLRLGFGNSKNPRKT